MGCTRWAHASRSSFEFLLPFSNSLQRVFSVRSCRSSADASSAFCLKPDGFACWPVQLPGEAPGLGCTTQAEIVLWRPGSSHCANPLSRYWSWPLPGIRSKSVAGRSDWLSSSLRCSYRNPARVWQLLAAGVDGICVRSCQQGGTIKPSVALLAGGCRGHFCRHPGVQALVPIKEKRNLIFC